MEYKKICLCGHELITNDKHVWKVQKYCSKSCFSKNVIAPKLTAYIKKNGNPNKGKKMSEEQRKKLIDSHKGKFGKLSSHYIHGKSRTREYISYHDHLARMKRRNVKGSHTFEEWENLKKTYKFMCLCCKRTEPEIKLTKDHIVPLTKGGTDYIWNIQPLCVKCNSSKYIETIDYRYLEGMVN